jgi:hypothetical protein
MKKFIYKIKCYKCEIPKPVEDFYSSRIKKNDYICKLCHKTHRKEWAKGNIKRQKYENKLSIIRCSKLVSIWLEYFKYENWHVCSKCGYKKCFWAIEFHHRNSEKKKFSIGNFIHNRGFTDHNKKLLNEEIKKCTILCANCHREEHYKNEKVRRGRNENKVLFDR